VAVFCPTWRAWPNKSSAVREGGAKPHRRGKPKHQAYERQIVSGLWLILEREMERIGNKMGELLPFMANRSPFAFQIRKKYL
jgi:hypothetical protein